MNRRTASGVEPHFCDRCWLPLAGHRCTPSVCTTWDVVVHRIAQDDDLLLHSGDEVAMRASFARELERLPVDGHFAWIELRRPDGVVVEGRTLFEALAGDDEPDAEARS